MCVIPVPQARNLAAIKVCCCCCCFRFCCCHTSAAASIFSPLEGLATFAGSGTDLRISSGLSPAVSSLVRGILAQALLWNGKAVTAPLTCFVSVAFASRNSVALCSLPVLASLVQDATRCRSIQKEPPEALILANYTRSYPPSSQDCLLLLQQGIARLLVVCLHLLSSQHKGPWRKQKLC